MTYSIKGIRDLEAARAQAYAHRLASARNMVPLWTDFITITQVASTTDFRTAVDPTLTRKFVNGMRVMIVRHRPNYADETFVAVAVIATAGPFSGAGRITTTGAVANVQVGDRIVPIMECLPLLDISGDAITATIVNLPITFDEVLGASTIPPVVVPGQLPPGYATYAGLPILNPHPSDEITIGIKRDGEIRTSGIGQVVRLDGTRGRVTIESAVLTLKRADAWKWRGFFDSRGGRCYPFWVLSPTNDLRVTARDGTGTVVTAFTGLDAFDVPKYHAALFLQMKDGSVLISKITSVARVGPNDEFTLTDPLGAFTLANVRRAGWAYLSRFDTDEMVETWRTDEVMRSEVRCIEVLEEKDVTVDVVTPIIGGTIGAHVYCTPSIVPGTGDCRQVCQGPVYKFNDQEPRLTVKKKVWRAVPNPSNARGVKAELGLDALFAGCTLSLSEYEAVYAPESLSDEWSGAMTWRLLSTTIPNTCPESIQPAQEFTWVCPTQGGDGNSWGALIEDFPRDFSGIYTSAYPLPFNRDNPGFPFDWPGGIAGQEFIQYVEYSLRSADGGYAWISGIRNPETGAVFKVEEARITGIVIGDCFPRACDCCNTAGLNPASLASKVDPGDCIRDPYSGECSIDGQFLCTGCKMICGDAPFLPPGPNFAGQSGYCRENIVFGDGTVYTLCGCYTAAPDVFPPVDPYDPWNEPPPAVLVALTCCYTKSSGPSATLCYEEAAESNAT